MSLRENIAKEIVRQLHTIDDPGVRLVTREPFEVADLPITQFPAILVISTNEARETVSMGAPAVGRRMGTITYQIRGFVRGTELDTRRNDLIEAIEEKLEEDRYLGLYDQGVIDTQVTNIEIVPRLAPLAEILINLDVRYNYVRGTT